MAEQPWLPDATGATFGVGAVHKILKTLAMRPGGPYGKRDSRNGGQHDPSTIIEIPVPVLIEREIFQRAQAKLGQNNPGLRRPASSTARHCLPASPSALPAAPA